MTVPGRRPARAPSGCCSRPRPPPELKRGKDAGYTTETVVVIALLVAMALAAIAIIAAKVLAKANGLNFG